MVFQSNPPVTGVSKRIVPRHVRVCFSSESAPWWSSCVEALKCTKKLVSKIISKHGLHFKRKYTFQAIKHHHRALLLQFFLKKIAFRSCVWDTSLVCIDALFLGRTTTIGSYLAKFHCNFKKLVLHFKILRAFLSF